MYKNTIIFLFILSLGVLTQGTCGISEDPVPDENDACMSCNNAIYEFRQVLGSFGCSIDADPAATQAVTDACGSAEAVVYTYYTAEMCESGSSQQATCQSEGKPSANVLVTCGTSASTSYFATISCDGNTTMELEVTAGVPTYFLDFVGKEGAEVIVTVRESGTTNEVTFTTTFTVVRPNNYDQSRSFVIDGSGNVIFNDW